MMRLTVIALLALACAGVAWLLSGTVDAGLTTPGAGRAHAVAAEADTERSLAQPAAVERAHVPAPRAETEPGPAPPEPPGPDAEEIWEEHEFDEEALLAAIGLPADAPRALLIGRHGPPDPLEPGDAALFLELFDAETGDAVASPVVLWRLDAPGNEYWLRGDMAVSQAQVAAGGHLFEDLPAGRYRAVCGAERAAAPHAPAFDVAGRTEQTLFLDMAGERPVRLELTADGERVERAELLVGPLVHRTAPSATPPWVRQREIRNPPDDMVMTDFEIGNAFQTRERWTAMLAGPDGFDLGSFPEDRRDTSYERTIRARDPNGRTGTALVHNAEPGSTIAVSAVLTAQ